MKIDKKYLYTLLLLAVVAPSVFAIDNCHKENQGHCQQCIQGYHLTRKNLCGQIISTSDANGIHYIEYFDPQTGNRITVSRRGTNTITTHTNQVIQRTAQTTVHHDLISQTTTDRSTVLHFPNCRNHNGTLCTSCNDGFILRQGTCIKGIIGCTHPSQQMNQQGDPVCQFCDSHFILVDGKCDDPNCNTQGQTGLCASCKQGFMFDQYNLACIDPNCMDVRQGRCRRCNNGFYVYNQMCIQKTRQNCRDFPSDQCDGCEPQQYLLINGTCTPLIAGCADHSATFGTCNRCMQGLEHKSGRCIDPQCKGQQDQQKFHPCDECIEGYILNDHKICVDQNCQVLDGTQCQSCKDGYKLDNNGLCQRIKTDCAENDGNTCIRCPQGYSFEQGDNQWCYLDPIQNCYKRNQQNITQCQQCSDNYYLNSNQLCSRIPYLCQEIMIQQGILNCKSCIYGNINSNGICQDPNCQQKNDFQCTKCKDNFVYSQQSLKCVYKHPQCLNFSITEGCEECKKGYTLTLSNQCTPICERFNENQQCIQCHEGFNLQSGICKPNFCYQASQNGICRDCIAGYFVNQIGRCSLNPFNCASVLNNKGECRFCYQGFVKINGNCEISADNLNCQQADQDDKDVCVKCNLGLYPLNGKCTRVSSRCADGKYNRQNGHCLACKYDFSLDEETGNCLDPYCQQDRGITCELCKHGYIKSNSGLCIIDQKNCIQFQFGNCVKCTEGYHLEDNGRCYFIPKDCSRTENQGQCSVCKDNYVIYKNECISGKCPMGFYLNNNRCYDYNCERQLRDRCEKCLDGFVYINGRCRDQNCEIQSSGSCQKCFPRYFYQENSNLCKLKNPNNCLKYIQPQCDVCPQQYFFAKGTGCQKRIQGCQKQILVDRCDQCLDGLAYEDGKCHDRQCSNGDYPNCQSCEQHFTLNSHGVCVDTNCADYMNQECKSCQSGYFLIQNRCIKLPDNCGQVDIDGQCLKCVSGYQFINIRNNKCIEQIDNCAQRNPNDVMKCGRCIDNYYVNQQYTCTRYQNSLRTDDNS